MAGRPAKKKSTEYKVDTVFWTATCPQCKRELTGGDLKMCGMNESLWGTQWFCGCCAIEKLDAIDEKKCFRSNTGEVFSRKSTEEGEVRMIAAMDRLIAGLKAKRRKKQIQKPTSRLGSSASSRKVSRRRKVGKGLRFLAAVLAVAEDEGSSTSSLWDLRLFAQGAVGL